MTEGKLTVKAKNQEAAAEKLATWFELPTKPYLLLLLRM